MPERNCPHCGTSSPVEVRFCRACGASLRQFGTDENFASPLDATIPLHADATSGSFEIPDHANDANGRHPSATLAHSATTHSTGDLASAHDDDETLVAIRQAFEQTFPVVAQTSALAPQFVTTPVNPNGAFTSALDDTEDTRLAAHASATLARAEPNAVAARARTASRQMSGGNWRWWLLTSACVAALAAVLTLGSLIVIERRSAASRIGATRDDSAALPATNPREESQRLTTEAERLLAAGATPEAIEKLREAVRLDDRNASAQFQLGAALERTGRRSEALVFYEAASALAPTEAQVWLRLADAQLGESRFPQAAQSYRRFFDITNSATEGGAAQANDPRFDDIRLRFAGALRLAGDEQQARSLYQQLAASALPEVRRAAQAQLSAIELAGDETASETTASDAPPETPAADETARTEQPRDTRTGTTTATIPPPSLPREPATNNRNPASVAAPAPRLSPQERFTRAVNLYATNRRAALAEFQAIAANVPDAHYYLGLARVEGRSPRSLSRPDLLFALEQFQRAQRGTRYAAQAARYADQLGREYDRRRR